MEDQKKANTVQQKLITIQAKLKAPKGQFNSFGKYSYRSCEDILTAVKPLCVAEGLLLVIYDQMVEIGSRVYVKSTAVISEGEKTVAVSAYAREAETKKGMDDSQITGACSSYARKYALNGLFLIDDTKDADSSKPMGDCLTEEQTANINALIEEVKPDIKGFLKFAGATCVDEIETRNYNKCVIALEQKRGQ